MPETKILIVEDDADTRKGLRIRLRAHEYQTVTAGDSISAVRAALTESPDLVILDLGLPGGDGFRVLDRFRDLAPLSKIPVIILTGRDPLTNKEKAESYGVEAFFQKPVGNLELISTISRLVPPGD